MYSTSTRSSRGLRRHCASRHHVQRWSCHGAAARAAHRRSPSLMPEKPSSWYQLSAVRTHGGTRSSPHDQLTPGSDMRCSTSDLRLAICSRFAANRQRSPFGRIVPRPGLNSPPWEPPRQNGSLVAARSEHQPAVETAVEISPRSRCYSMTLPVTKFLTNERDPSWEMLAKVLARWALFSSNGLADCSSRRLARLRRAPPEPSKRTRATHFNHDPSC